MAGTYGLLDMYAPKAVTGIAGMSVPELSFANAGLSAAQNNGFNLGRPIDLLARNPTPSLPTGTLDISKMTEFGGNASAAGTDTASAWGDALGVVGGAFTAINNLNANIEAYNKAKENYAMAQINTLNIFDEADDVAEDMRAEADSREATNLARSARSGLTAQAYDNLMLSDRVQTEKDVLAMKEDAQFEAVSMLNTARRIKSRQKRKATVGAIGTAILAIATAGAGLAAAGVFGAGAMSAVGSSVVGAMKTTLSVGNMINSGITGAMSNGR